MTTRDILVSARNALARGWCQHVMFACATSTGFSKRCSLGAIIGATRTPSEAEAARNFLEEFLGERLVVWNDDPHRTQEEVLAVFDSAIEALASARV